MPLYKGCAVIMMLHVKQLVHVLLGMCSSISYWSNYSKVSAIDNKDLILIDYHRAY